MYIKARITNSLKENKSLTFNRQKRRRLLIKNGVYLPYMDAVNEVCLKDGDKVTLNYNQITSRKDWKRKLSNYKSFVNENKNKIFTLQMINEYKNIVELKEDISKPRWRFWIGDLIKVKEDVSNDSND